MKFLLIIQLFEGLTIILIFLSMMDHIKNIDKNIKNFCDIILKEIRKRR